MIEEKHKVYLGFLPKEEIRKYIKNFKKALAEGEGEKTGDKKVFDLEIKRINEEPKGVSSIKNMLMNQKNIS